MPCLSIYFTYSSLSLSLTHTHTNTQTWCTFIHTLFCDMLTSLFRYLLKPLLTLFFSQLFNLSFIEKGSFIWRNWINRFNRLTERCINRFNSLSGKTICDVFTWLSGSVTLTALSAWSMSGLMRPFEFDIAFVSDRRDAPELLRDKLGGARRFVAPRPASRLLRREGLLDPDVLTHLQTTIQSN